MKEISLNFGAIKDTVVRLSKWELLKEDDSKTLREFVNKVKESPALMKQQLIYKNFTDCKPFEKKSLAERYLAQQISIIKGANWFNILDENKKIRIGLLENHHVESTEQKNNDLYEHIHIFIESVTRPNFKETEDSQKSFDFLLEFLTRNIEDENKSEEKNENPSLLNWKFVTNMAVNNFNKRYAHLNEDEKEVLKMMLSEDDKKINYIEDLRLDNLKKIDDAISANKKVSQEKLNMLGFIKSKLQEGISAEREKYNDYILNYFEINKELKNIV